MISWQIATTFEGLTGSTLVHNRYSYSSSYINFESYEGTATATREGSESSSSEFYSREFGGNGFYEFVSYSSHKTSNSGSFSEFLTGSFEDDEGATQTTTQSSSGSNSYDIADDSNYQSSEYFSSQFFTVFNTQTTTEISAEVGDWVIASTTNPAGIEYEYTQPFYTWTTYTFSNSNVTPSISRGIATEFGEHTAYWFLSFANTKTAMVKVVTTGEETATYAALATVIEAGDNEVIYWENDPGSMWGGFAPAAGSSATRITLSPRIITAEGISGLYVTGEPLSFTITRTVTQGAGTSTSTSTSTLSVTTPANGGTFSNGSLTTAITRSVLSGYTSSTTRVINLQNQLPHVTTSQQITLTRTQTSSSSFLIFNSGSGVYGGGATTRQVSTIGYVPENLTLYGPGYSYNGGIATSLTNSQIIENMPVFLSSTTTGGDDNGGFTLSTIHAGNTSVGTFQIGVSNNGQYATVQRRHGTAGFVLAGEKGGYFTCPHPLTVSTAIDGSSGRHGTTLINFSNTSATVSSDSYSRRTTTGPDTATDTTLVTGLISISGGTGRKDDAASALGLGFQAGRAYLHFGGGPFAPGWTVVEGAEGGAYTDLINGGTASFRGDHTSRAGGGGSAAISRYAPIPYYTPPAGGAGGPIYWIVQKNSTQLYPNENLAVNTFGIVDR